MATFSWSDTFKIVFKSCSSCLWSTQEGGELQQPDFGENSAINSISRTRSDELQGLLADPDTDVEAERMSLHSNPGRDTQRKKKKKSRRKTSSSRRITLFGYNLFGRDPQIQLTDEHEDALYPRHGTTTPNTQSTFDSDAAPLDTDAIAALSSPTSAAAVIEAAVQASAEFEAQRLREKEERRRKRREKKELKRVAELLARQGNGDQGEFEGFQGSEGNVATHNRSIPSASDSSSGSRPRMKQPAAISGPHLPPLPGDEDAADLDGEHYARNAPSGSNGRRSDSRSRTSASMSDRGPTGQQKPKTKSSSSRNGKSSSSATSQSPDLSHGLHIVSPSTIEQGQGFFDIGDSEIPVRKPESGYMPITGFGGPRTSAHGRMANNLGAVLAQRGDDRNTS